MAYWMNDARADRPEVVDMDTSHRVSFGAHRLRAAPAPILTTE
jgi:hypothetical protein